MKIKDDINNQCFKISWSVKVHNRLKNLNADIIFFILKIKYLKT